jgi:hypothetical protein
VRDVSDRAREIVPLDPERLIAVLAAHRVRYVLIGALGARMQGFSRVTADADITPARDDENLKHLASALRELDARVFTETIPEGLAFDFTARALSNSELWNLVTTAGRLDIAFVPSGTTGYDDLARDAVQFDVNGTLLQVARLEDIIRSKIAANRPQDRQDVVVMRELLERRGDA